MTPFRGSAARADGTYSRRALAHVATAIYRDVYQPREAILTARDRAEAAWLATGSPLVGLSAAALWGTRWLDPAAPAEVQRANRRAPPGMVVRSWHVADDEWWRHRGMTLTSPARTAFDLARTLPADRVVATLDALARATGVTREAVLAVAAAHPGVRHVRRVPEMLAWMDAGAESPPESRLRVVLIRAGLPRPETQIAFPALRIRVDMGWRAWQVAVEYDGVQHWEDAAQRAWDIDRIGLLEDAGWSVVRVSAAMMRRPDDVVSRVRARLRTAGAPV